MIVSFSDIPSDFLTPLKVDTDARYTLDMKRFPGLSNDGQPEPALITVPQKVNTDRTDQAGEPCSSQFCLPSTITTSFTPKHSTSYLHKSEHPVGSLFESQRELCQLLDSYQKDFPYVSSTLSNPIHLGHMPSSCKGNYTESCSRNVNEHGEVCVISPRKMLSRCPKITCGNLKTCPLSAKKIGCCARVKDSQNALDYGSRNTWNSLDGSVHDGVSRSLTLQSCSGSNEINISGSGVRQGFPFARPLVEPGLSRPTFPTPDYFTENNSQFVTEHRFLKASCSFRNRVVPYTSGRDMCFKTITNNHCYEAPTCAQLTAPVIYNSVFNIRSFNSECGAMNNHCLRA